MSHEGAVQLRGFRRETQTERNCFFFSVFSGPCLLMAEHHMLPHLLVLVLARDAKNCDLCKLQAVEEERCKGRLVAAEQDGGKILVKGIVTGVNSEYCGSTEGSRHLGNPQGDGREIKWYWN